MAGETTETASNTNWLDVFTGMVDKGVNVYTTTENRKAQEAAARAAAAQEAVLTAVTTQQNVNAKPAPAPVYTSAPPTFFGYLQSFSPEQWLMMGGALVVGVVLLKAVK